MRLLVIDCETTGLSPTNNQVLTVGLLLVEIRREEYDIIDSEHIKIKHRVYHVSGIALKINKINLEKHHKEAIDIKEACKIINRFIEKYDLFETPLLGHNIKFDIAFIQNLYQETEEEFNHCLEHIDTWTIWNSLKQEGVIPFKLKGSLKVLAKYFQVSYKGAHNALIDCKITLEVYNSLLNVLENRTNPHNHQY
jgi:DNA polymerase III epsilon subunit-like protein